jgi:hypothetical protein
VLENETGIKCIRYCKRFVRKSWASDALRLAACFVWLR